MNFIKQLNEQDCGFACLKMVLADVYNKKEFLYLRQDLNHSAYSFKELIDIGNANGLMMNGYFYDDEDAFIKEKPKNVMVPLKSKSGGKHMVIVKKVLFNRVYIKDPYQGNYTLSKKKFFKLWDKTILKIDEVRGYQRLPSPPYKVKLSKRIGLILLRVAGFITTITGLLFLDNTVDLWIPIIFIGVSFIIEILYRILSIKLMRQIDKDVLINIKKCRSTNAEFIDTFSKYKQIDVMLYPGVALSVCMTMFIVALFVLNDVYNLVPILLICLYTFIDSMVINPWLEKKKKDIEVEEFCLRKQPFDEKFIPNFLELNNKSYRFGTTYIGKKIFTIIFVILITIGFMYFSHITNLAFIVFYSFGYWYLYNNLSYILSFKNDLDSLTYYRLLLMNIIKDKN